MEEKGNPFLDKTNELLVLDSKDIASTEVLRSVHITEKLGQDQYQAFVDERLTAKSKSVIYICLTIQLVSICPTP